MLITPFFHSCHAQNLALSTGDNEEVCYCLQAWQELPASIKNGLHPSKDEALKVRSSVMACLNK